MNMKCPECPFSCFGRSIWHFRAAVFHFVPHSGKSAHFFWALLHLRHLDMGTRVAAMYICASECQFEVAKWALRALFIKSATPSALHNVGLACGGREVDLHARSPHEC